MKKHLAVLSAAVAAGLALSACGGSSANTQTTAAASGAETAAADNTGAETSGGQIDVQVGPSPETIDPALNSAVDGGTMIDHAFEGLYTVAYGTTPTPGQAESVEISEDGLTYTFHLREGLKWSDGTPLTAHDFVYSWQRAVDPATGADYAYMFECIAGYTEAINGEEYVAPAADASSASTSESAAESVSASTSESASTSAAA